MELGERRLLYDLLSPILQDKVFQNQKFAGKGWSRMTFTCLDETPEPTAEAFQEEELQQIPDNTQTCRFLVTKATRSFLVQVKCDDQRDGFIQYAYQLSTHSSKKCLVHDIVI